MVDFSVILPAAGSSTRFGSPVNKLLQDLGGLPVLTRTLLQFAQRADVREIVIATHDRVAALQCVEKLRPALREKIRLCAGGTCRAGSVRAGLEAVANGIEWVAVHDAARPLVSQEVIDRTFSAANQHGAAAAALPVHLTIKQAIGPLPAPVQRTLPREQLWAMQTPQAMRREDLAQAFANCPIPLEQVTDDVQLLELAEKRVWLVPGDERNIKITTQLDLQIARGLLS
jgi:2-C-methyl-D-erythritol 4-phosphate cytidylyltransferase